MTAGKRILLLAVAAFLSASAALAVGILLVGDFEETEGRILATTALLGLFGLLALPRLDPARPGAPCGARRRRGRARRRRRVARDRVGLDPRASR